MFMWRAVDNEGEVLDVLVQKRRNKAAALKLLRKLLKKQGFMPDAIVTDGLKSYRAAMKILGCQNRHHPGRLRDKVVSVQCEPLSGRRADPKGGFVSGSKDLPLCPSGRATLFESLTINEVAFGIEMVVQGGMD